MIRLSHKEKELLVQTVTHAAEDKNHGDDNVTGTLLVAAVLLSPHPIRLDDPLKSALRPLIYQSLKQRGHESFANAFLSLPDENMTPTDHLQDAMSPQVVHTRRGPFLHWLFGRIGRSHHSP